MRRSLLPLAVLLLLSVAPRALATTGFQCVAKAGSARPLLGERFELELSDHGAASLRYGNDKSCGKDLMAAKKMTIKVDGRDVAVRQLYFPKDSGCDILFAIDERMLVSEPGIVRIRVMKAETVYDCSPPK